MAMEFAMTTIVVDQYDRAIEYYTKVLGFTLTEDTALSPEKRWVSVRPGEHGACTSCNRGAEISHRTSSGWTSWLLFAHGFFRL